MSSQEGDEDEMTIALQKSLFDFYQQSTYAGAHWHQQRRPEANSYTGRLSSASASSSASLGRVHSAAKVDRTVILMGSTGSGKSTLGNVLAGCERSQFEFTEGSYGVAQTQMVEEKVFTVPCSERTYTLKIVDTIGIGDGKLSPEDVLSSFGEVCDSCKDGIHQIFFVTKDRFSEAEKETWKVVQKVIFDNDVADYTSIVRTHVDPGNLTNPGWIMTDLKKLCQGDDEVSTIFRNIGSRERVFYVCHQNEQSGNPNWFEHRQESRERLLLHLIHNCDVPYKPRQLDEFNERVGGYVQLFKMTVREVGELKEEIRQLRAETEAKSQRERKLEEEVQRRQQRVTMTETEMKAYGEALRELKSLREDNIRLKEKESQLNEQLTEKEKDKDEAKGSMLGAVAGFVTPILAGIVTGPIGSAVGKVAADIVKDKCTIM